MSDRVSHPASDPVTPLKIVYLWDADYPWDVRTEKICGALTAAGHEVHIVARNKQRRPERETLAEGIVHRMPAIRWIGARLNRALGFPAFFSPRWRRLLTRVVQEVKADLIIVRDLPLCPLAISVGHSHGIPVVLDMAENYPAMMQEIWDAGRQRWFDVAVRNPKIVARVERQCLASIDHVITVVKESSERIIQAGLEPDRVDVVSNTPSKTRVAAESARANEPHDRLHIVYLGLMEIPRGVGELLQAAAQLVSRRRAIRLTLIGGGRDEAIFREQARTLGLGDVAEFHGYVQNAKALALVATADVGIVPHHADESWNTTIPNKLFDYMAAGLPVISSDAIPCKRVLQETHCGEVFRSGDANDLARAIDVFFDPATRDAAGKAGRGAILNHYNWEEDSARLQNVVVRTVARGVRVRERASA